MAFRFACLATLTAMVFAGCSSLKEKNQAVIRVQSKRDTPRAIELTHAGIRALSKEHFAKAANHFRGAIEADYTYGPAHNNLGLMHYEQGNLYQAVLAFEQAREYLPEDPAVVYNLALALESAGRDGEALELYYIANAMDQTHPNYLGNLVRLRVRLGERDELLEQQLRDLALIETRPDWRRWTDIQLALVMNPMLDRGPAEPDLESTVNDANEATRGNLRTKIIDLTPVVPASLEQPVEEDTEPVPAPNDPTPVDPEKNRSVEPSELPAVFSGPESELGPMLEDGQLDDLNEEDYYRD